MLKTGPWNLSDLKDIPKNGKTVFSCFHCGGGSTMGYKLSGFDVLGGVEIDPEMMAIYKANHNPKHSYLMGVQDFVKIPNDQLPKELFNLDILDGSPPCSSFSMAGSREDAWGENKKFREGQAVQVLDDLFFEFIKVAEKLKPKIVVAENVKGLILGKAKGYVKQIAQQFDKVGYDVQLFLLNAAFMGVPQRRERTFFVARRKDLSLEKIGLVFKESPISLEVALVGTMSNGKKLPPSLLSDWNLLRSGKKGRYISTSLSDPRRPCSTLTSKATTAEGGVMHWGEPRKFSVSEVVRISSFPDDYNFIKTDAGYLCGMSVPPYMMNRVSNQIYKQWLKNA